MRTLKILLVLVAVILSGFSKDSQKTEAGVVVPMKYWGTIFPDHSKGDIPCTPVEAGITHARYGYNQGHQTHGGQLIPELSTWEITGCSTDFATKLNVSQVEGVITVANGDSYSYTCIMIIDIVTKSVNINLTVTGGTGRFEGATGEIILNGGYDGNIIPISGEGFITFRK